MIRILSFTDRRILKLIIRASHEAQGLGWGASTIEVETKFAAQFLENARSHNPLVLDVGANLGTWSIAFNTRVASAQIIAFEPSSKTFEGLRRNTDHINQIQIEQLGFSNFSGSSTLYSDAPESGFASLSKRRLEHFGIQFSDEEVVQITTLDEYTSKLGVYPSLIKLDVEGHELNVLAGGEKTLSKVKVIQFEFGGCNLDTKTSFQDFWYWFTERNFEIYRLTPRGLWRIANYSEADEIYQTTNYFAVRRS
jgi:FkbM family methyltransferase